MTLPSMRPGRVSASRVRDVLHYDPATGVFTWVEKTGPRCVVGRPAGRRSSPGYVQITIDGYAYAAHRLAFLWMNGEWPGETVDHMNGVRHDNRWENLRSVPFKVNAQNVRSAYRNKKSGLPLGVSTNGSGWMARIRGGGGPMHIGTFESPEAAHAAYVEKKRELHAGCLL